MVGTRAEKPRSLGQPSRTGKPVRACYSHLGNQRAQNEDACALPAPGVAEDRLGTLLALADGAGGVPGGAEASREAVAYLQAVYYAGYGPPDPGERLRAAVVAVNALNRMGQRKQTEANAHLSTLVAAVILDEQIWIANVGDSRAYLASPAQPGLHQLSEDHSARMRSAKAGQAGQQDPRQDFPEGAITRAIGLDDDCQVDTYRYTWSPGDRLLLCSDGLIRLSQAEMWQTLFDGPVGAVARLLVLKAVAVDGSDNCTALVAAWRQGNQGRVPTPSRSLTKNRSRQTIQRAASRKVRPVPGWLGLFLFGLLIGLLTAGLFLILYMVNVRDFGPLF